MEELERDFLQDDKIPEAVKVAYVENTFSRLERERYEPDRQRLAGRQLWLGVPVVVALVSVVSVVVSQLFAVLLERIQGDTEQKLELLRLRSLELEERVIEYEILARELNAARSNKERAEMLLFLKRIGMLHILKDDDIENLAKAGIAGEAVIPALSPLENGVRAEETKAPSPN